MRDVPRPHKEGGEQDNPESLPQAPLPEGEASEVRVNPLIELVGVSKLYAYTPALRGITLAIARGECAALLGHNGSGKSTLLRLLCGLSKPTAGAIRVGGWSLPREAAAVRAQIGLVSHRPLLYDGLTGRENLAFFARLYPIDPHTIPARIDRLLEQVGLTKRADAIVRAYSRGMQQRLSIARALIHDPAILLLDEPYTGLDPDAAIALDRLIREAHTEGRTIVMTTHDIDRAETIATRAIVLARGQIAHDGAAGDLAAVYARASGGA